MEDKETNQPAEQPAVSALDNQVKPRSEAQRYADALRLYHERKRNQPCPMINGSFDPVPDGYRLQIGPLEREP